MPENRQVPMPGSFNGAGVVKLHSVFPTIQGEGPFCGERAMFFRLMGCNLRCPGCDTEYTSKSLDILPTYMARKCRDYGWEKGALVVITGGEPFRQSVVPSILALLDAGYRVQVETNGVLCPSGLPWTDHMFSVVCSPKTHRIHDDILAHASAFKYVLRHGEVDDDGLPTRALMHPSGEKGVARPRPGALVYVQPMDEGEAEANALNLAAAIDSTLRYGHRLQIQVHKTINME